MAKRRSNDEGTIFEYPEGSGIWYAQLPPDAAGKRPKRRASTRREALQKLRELQSARAKGINLTSKIPSFADLASTWLEDVAKRRVAESTHAVYGEELRMYVLPRIGSIRVDKITPQLLQRLVNDMADEEYGLSTITKAKNRTSSVLDLAVDYRLIAFNPMVNVRLPRLPRRKARALSFSELAVLIPFLQAQPLWIAWRLLITLGLRRGEALGTSWRGVNWEAATLTIDQQVRMVGGGSFQITPHLKSEHGKRIIPLPPLLLAELRDCWARQQILRREWGTRWKEHGLIVCHEGLPYNPVSLSHAFSEACKDLGIDPARLHDLRHTAATFWGEQGAMPHVIRDILGHGSKTITEHYTHASLKNMREVLETFERSLFDTSAPVSAPAAQE